MKKADFSATRAAFTGAALFVIITACLRVLDIKTASMRADVMADGTLTTALGVVESLLSTASSSAAAALSISLGAAGYRQASTSALLFSAVVILDRASYVVYSLATHVPTFMPGAGAEAFVRVALDAASFAAAFVAAAKCAAQGKKTAGASPARGAALFAAIPLAVQTAYQIYVTVSFHLSYDDVTSAERSAIAGDFLFILLKYGVVTFGLTIGAIKFILPRISKNDAPCGDKVEKV